MLCRSEGLVWPQARPVRRRIDAARLVPAPGRRIEEEFVGGLPVDADRPGRGLRLALDLAACGETARAIAWPAPGAGIELVAGAAARFIAVPSVAIAAIDADAGDHLVGQVCEQRLAFLAVEAVAGRGSGDAECGEIDVVAERTHEQ